MSYNGRHVRCKSCAFYDKPNSMSCVGCYAGMYFTPKYPRKSKVRYADIATKDGRRTVIEYKKYLDSIIEKVIFNPPATIVLWKDGYPKTVVKCQPGDVYDREKGLAMCIAKRCTGNTSAFCNVFKKWCGEYTLEDLGESIKNTMVVTMSVRAAYMHNNGEIKIPNGPCDNTVFAKWVKEQVDIYFNNHEHYHKFNIDFDSFMIRRLQEKYHIDKTLWPKENPHVDTKAVIHASRKELRDEFLVRAAGEMQFLSNHGEIVPPIDADRTRKYVIEVVDRYINNPDVYKGDFLQYIDSAFKEDFGKHNIVKGEN